MRLRIATWNINSLRLREEQVCRVLKQKAPDILCLQEIKSPVELVPTIGFESIGYNHFIARGEKGYNGVAIISRLPLERNWFHDFCSKGDARHISAITNCGITIENFYVPAGGDVPDRDLNKKFEHKLDFLEEMSDYFSKRKPKKAKAASVKKKTTSKASPAKPAAKKASSKKVAAKKQATKKSTVKKSAAKKATKKATKKTTKKTTVKKSAAKKATAKKAPAKKSVTKKSSAKKTAKKTTKKSTKK